MGLSKVGLLQTVVGAHSKEAAPSIELRSLMKGPDTRSHRKWVLARYLRECPRGSRRGLAHDPRRVWHLRTFSKLPFLLQLFGNQAPFLASTMLP